MNISYVKAILNLIKVVAFADFFFWLAYCMAVSFQGGEGAEILFSVAVALLIVVLKLGILLVIFSRLDRMAVPLFVCAMIATAKALEYFHWSHTVLLFCGACLCLLVVMHVLNCLKSSII